LVQQGTQREALTRIFSKMFKSPSIENEFNTYSVVEMQIKRNQFVLIKITTKNRKKIFDMGLQISLGLKKQSRFLVVPLGLHPSPLGPRQV